MVDLGLCMDWSAVKDRRRGDGPSEDVATESCAVSASRSDSDLRAVGRRLVMSSPSRSAVAALSFSSVCSDITPMVRCSAPNGRIALDGIAGEGSVLESLPLEVAAEFGDVWNGLVASFANCCRDFCHCGVEL